jgi:hypothetical protein
MVMRYHWGLAAGHTYTYAPDFDSSDRSSTPSTSDDTGLLEPETSALAVDTYMLVGDEDEDDPEFGFENREDDMVEEEVVSEEEQGLEDDDEFLAMHNMYGSAFD